LGRSDKTEAIQSARRRALTWLERAESGRSTEWYAARLLLSQQQGDAERLKSTIEHLKSKQNTDGGWGWLLEDPSDALATGQAVYALSVAGVAPDDPSIRRAQQFLIGTQQPDGAWPVHGTKEKKKAQVEETATYWGTAWATIALLQTLR
jgi:squalene-hopene/tetraprenyl-beta-curcumene cyclase